MKLAQWSAPRCARNPIQKRPGCRGSVLVMTALLSSTVVLLLSSFTMQVRDSIATTRGSNSTLTAEFMAGSALEYAIMQLSLDQGWDGSDWIDLGQGESFRVTRTDDGSDPSQVQLVLDGISGAAESRLGATVDASDSTGGILENAAVAIFGGDFDINNADIRGGDLVVVDDPRGVLDYDPVAEDWVPSAIAPGSIDDNNWTIWGGEVVTYGEEGGSPYLNQNRSIATSPVEMVAWDMDQYLVPGPDRIITSQTHINNFSTDKTVVFVVPPGAEIKLNNADLLGGVVVYTEPDFDPRGAPRNEISIDNVRLGGGDGGIRSNIGVIAPGAHARNYNNAHPILGLTHVHSAHQFNNFTSEGPVFVSNGPVRFNNCDMTLPDDFWLNSDFPGMMGGGGGGGSDPEVIALWEDFDAVVGLQYGS